MELITAAKGSVHITPLQDSLWHRAIIGAETCILQKGNKFAPQVMNNTLIRIKDGVGMIQGRFFCIEPNTYDEVELSSGSQGVNRIDIICAKITANGDGTQTGSWEIVEGDPTTGSPVTPEYTEGNLDNGDPEALFGIIKVTFEGASITSAESINEGAQSILLSAPLSSGAAAHNTIYRGKYLGSAVTDEQYARIQDGTFHDLFIGDYWTIDGINWRIADFDYWYGTGDTECTTHHAVIVPDTELYKAQMNTSNVVTGAYVGSRMYTTNLATAKTTINNAFGSAHILSKRLHLQNAATNGYSSGGTWYDSTVDLMNEINVYGSKIYGDVINGTNWPNLYTTDNSQFALFRHDHSRIIGRDANNNRSAWWLRDVANTTSFARVNSYGLAGHNTASTSLGVRPAFGIC